MGVSAVLWGEAKILKVSDRGAQYKFNISHYLKIKRKIKT